MAELGRLGVVIMTFVYILPLVGHTVAIICFQCADSTNDKEKASCLYGINGLKDQHSKFKDQEPVSKLHDVKNCSNYEHFNTCKIETIESYGIYTGFIRDCSDGKTFSFNSTKLGQVKSDNQTTCSYSDTIKATLCVTICDSDLCNGPDSAHAHAASIVTTLAVVAVAFCIKLELL